MHISTIDGLIQALQQIRAQLATQGIASAATPVVMLYADAPVPVAVRQDRISKTGPKRLVKTGGTPCVVIGRSR